MTLKSFKAAVKVGTTLTVLDHWLPRCHNQKRIVTKVQGNGYWFTDPTDLKPDGTPRRLWGDFPKSSELRFDGKVAHVMLSSDPAKFLVLAFDVVQQ